MRVHHACVRACAHVGVSVRHWHCLGLLLPGLAVCNVGRHAAMLTLTVDLLWRALVAPAGLARPLRAGEPADRQPDAAAW